ncbi:MAG: hypothetical protein HYT75_04540 [Deltaproteobacteria bacterium]|nr:hypothetical protein [Deltaproteobacteria bacterium]
MRITRLIMISVLIVSFLAFTPVRSAYPAGIGTQSSAAVVQKAEAEKGFFEKIVDGIANIADEIAKAVSKAVNFLKGNRVAKDTEVPLIKPSEADKSVIQVGPQSAEVQSERITQDKQIAEVESEPVKMIPMQQASPQTIVQQPVIQQPVIQQQAAVIEQEPVYITPERTDTFSRATGLNEIQQQQIEENESIGIQSEAVQQPEEKPAEVLIPKSEAVVNIPQVKDESKSEVADKRVEETVPVISGSIIIAGNLPNIPSQQTQTSRTTTSTTTTSSATGVTTRPQSPIVQSGEVLGTAATTESPLELMGRQSVAQTGDATRTENSIREEGARTETVTRSQESCGETRVLFSDSIRKAALTADKRYVVADAGDGKRSVVSVCSGLKIDCTADASAERSITVSKRAAETETSRTGETAGTAAAAATEESVRAGTDACRTKLTITRGELSEDTRAEMLDICKQSEELFQNRTGTGDVSEIKLASVVASSSLLYVTNDMVRTMEVDSSDQNKPILDANIIVANNVIQFKPLVFCMSGDAVSECSGKYDEVRATASDGSEASSASCEMAGSRSLTLLARAKGVEVSTTLDIGKEASSEQAASEASDEKAAGSTEVAAAGTESGQETAGQAAESAAKDLPQPDIYESLPPGGEAQEIPLQTSKSFGPSEVSGGGGCSLAARTDMNIVPIWVWLIFSIGFACVAVIMLLKSGATEVVRHEQKNRNSYRRRRLPGS